GIIILSILSVIWIFTGYLWGKKANNLDGFMLAGRKVGLALGTATAMATWVTSNTTMLAPQFALQLGIWGMLAYATASIGLILFAPMAKRIKELMPHGITSGDFILQRYGKKVWFLFLIISLFYSITWMISMAMAGGILLQTLSGIPYIYGMSVILFVCVSYTLFGGMYAVIGTDFIQSILILIGVVVVGFSVLTKINIDSVYNHIHDKQPALLMVFLPAALISLFNNLLFGVGEIFHSNVWWSRAFAMDKGVGEKAYTLAAIFWFPIPIAAGFIALASGTLSINVTSPDMVGPLIAAKVLGKVGAIIVFIVIFSSLASSVDSLLAATSDLLTEDVYRRIINPKADEKNLKKVSGIIIVLLGVLTWLFCIPRIGTLATILFFAGPMVGSTIFPILLGLYWKKANSEGAFWALILGTVVGLISYFFIGWYSASLIGTAISMIVTFLFTFLKPEDFDWNKLKSLNHSEQENSL
ncbi:MAG: sodium:solute symporter family protein, partial [Leptospiraceae bacterium]|nr:sodium:solute symporter family protein [Leptospiraceae bacterium]